MGVYAGIVEAVLAAEDHEDGDDYHQVAHVGLSVVDLTRQLGFLTSVGTQHERSLYHNLS
jgi:hypothetical protein